MLVRQAVLVGGVLLCALILFFLVRGCASDARKRGLRDYNQQASRIDHGVRPQIAKPFFDLMNDAKGQSPADLQSTISGYRTEAEQQFKSAQKLSVPGPDGRRAALAAEVARVPPRRAGRDRLAHHRRAERRRARPRIPAIAAIAGQMQAFLASDVIYDARVVPLIKKGLEDGDAAAGQTVADSQFLPGVEWLSPSYVADKLGAQAPTSGGRRRGQPAPGLHGTGLQGVSAGDVTLQPSSPNRDPGVHARRSRSASPTRASNDETDVQVTLTVEGGSKPIKAQRTVNLVQKGQTATANLELPTRRRPWASR